MIIVYVSKSYEATRLSVNTRRKQFFTAIAHG